MEPDSTLVTGSPAGLKLPRAGDVVCERFEVRDVLEADGLVVSLRGLDQETDLPVLIRVSAPGLLNEREARGVVERLRQVVGARGHSTDGPSAWPGLLDADREGALALTVEPWPSGTSFRAVLDARRAKGKRLDAAELLPLVGRIAAALDALAHDSATELFHGDLRAQRVFVNPDGVRLTGAFLLAALPGENVAEVARRDTGLRGLPPEALEGMAGHASDRFAVAAIVWEALVGAAPVLTKAGRVDAARARHAGLDEALTETLERYLQADPAARPARLQTLVLALATAAGGAAPTHEDRLVVGDVVAPEEPRSETGSYTLADGEILTVDTQPTPPTAKAAPAKNAPAKTAKRGEGLDPSLVAAARAASAISETGTFKLDDDELVPVGPLHAANVSAPTPTASSAKASPAPASASPAPIKPSPAKPSPAPVKASPAPSNTSPAPSNASPAPVKASPAPSNASPAPAKSAPVPAPAASPPVEASIVVAPEPRPRAEWEHQALPRSATPLPALNLPASAAATSPAEPPKRGAALIVGALVFAMVILGIAFWFRAHQEQLRHEQAIDERLRDLTGAAH